MYSWNWFKIKGEDEFFSLRKTCPLFSCETRERERKKMRIDFEGEWISTITVNIKGTNYFIVVSSKDKSGNNRLVEGEFVSPTGAFKDEQWALKFAARKMWGIGLKYAPDFVKTYAYKD